MLLSLEINASLQISVSQKEPSTLYVGTQWRALTSDLVFCYVSKADKIVSGSFAQIQAVELCFGLHASCIINTLCFC